MTWYHEQVLIISKRQYPRQQTIDQLSRGKNYIDRHFCEDIDLKEIAEISFLSKFHYIRLFRQCYGMTPYQYMIDKRMGLAKKQLISGKTVVDTCYHIGLDSPTSFSAMFKKYAGLSPSQFKKKQFSIRFSKNAVPALGFIKQYVNEN